MDKNKLLIIMLAVVFSGVIILQINNVVVAQMAPQNQGKASFATTTKDASMTDKNFEEYVSDGKYFSILVPKGWSKDEALMTRRNMKVFGVEMASPLQDENEIPVKITAEYYAKDNTLYKTPEKFIKRFSKPDPTMPGRGRKYGKVQPTTVAGKRAKQFERRIPQLAPPHAVEQKEIQIYERYIVVPVKDGFYVLTYQCPMSSAKLQKPVFDKIVSSFKLFKK